MVHGSQPKEMNFKLCDMGRAHQQLTSRFAMTSTNTFTNSNKKRIQQGTVSFEAPEVFLQQIKTFESDIYSFAMVMYELLHPTLCHPWEAVFSCGSPDTIRLSIIAAVKSGKRPPVTEITPYTILMKKCWADRPDQRPSPTELQPLILDVKTGRSTPVSSSEFSLYYYPIILTFLQIVF